MLARLFKNKIANNAIWLIGAKLIQSILGFIISLFSARYLGPSNYGILNYASSIVAFVLPIAQLGLTNTLVQEIVNDEESEGKIIGTSVLMTSVSALFCILGIFSFTFFVNANETDTIVVCMLYSISLIPQMLEIIVYWFQAKLFAKYSSIISLIAYLVVSAYKIYLLITNKNIFWFAVSNSLDFLIIAILSFVFYKKLGGKRLSFSKNTAKLLFANSKHYIFASLMLTIYSQTDRIMIKLMIDDANVGFYSAATTCAVITGFLFTAIIDSFRPVIFNNKKTNDVEKYELNLKRTFCIVFYLSLVQSLLMTIFSKWIILILYGSSYQNSIDILKIVVWYTTFAYVGTVRNIWLLGEQKQKYLLIINTVGSVANIVLNFIFIPLMGTIGAAIASLITQMFSNMIIGFFIKPIRKGNLLMFEAMNPKYLLNLLTNK